jgi:predicted DNA-binding WGR domain protein
MKTAQFNNKQDAEDFLRVVKAQGKRGYVLSMRASFHEVRFWA